MKNAIKHPVNKCALSTYLLYSGTEIEREKPQTQLLTSQHLQHDKDRPFENKCCVVNATDMWGHVEALAGCDGVQVWGGLTLPVCRNSLLCPCWETLKWNYTVPWFQTWFTVLKLKFLWWVIRDWSSISLGKRGEGEGEGGGGEGGEKASQEPNWCLSNSLLYETQLNQAGVCYKLRK